MGLDVSFPGESAPLRTSGARHFSGPRWVCSPHFCGDLLPAPVFTAFKGISFSARQ